jgi:hypothetical protein
MLGCFIVLALKGLLRTPSAAEEHHLLANQTKVYTFNWNFRKKKGIDKDVSGISPHY